MSRNIATGLSMIVVLAVAAGSAVAQDVVLQWNASLRNVIQHEGAQPIHQANPGWSTRAIAMMNTAIYDVFQAKNRTHKPWLVNTQALPNTSLEAAVHQAAYDILTDCYAGESAILLADYNARMALVPGGVEKTNGIALGAMIAQACMVARDADGSDPSTWAPYTALDGAPYWRPQPGQNAWGPGWGTVKTFGIPDSASFVNALPPVPDVNSQAYTDAFNQVKDWGALNSPQRAANPDATDIGLFWAYDRPSMGPPPVLFIRNLEEIADQTDNTPEENARLFAMASVAQADAAVASWDAKFKYNFWRPIGAIQGDRIDGTKGHDDGNPSTAEDVDWRPLGAPGGNPASSDDDFTPPFPAYTSGHATMGGAIFKAIELFYGTNDFDDIDGIDGNDAAYTLTSQEAGGNGVFGMTRDFVRFTQDELLAGGPLTVGNENSPEGENGTSRIYLGIHWIFDQRDGITLGNDIAEYIAANYFQAVPEPGALPLAVFALVGGARLRRRGRLA